MLTGLMWLYIIFILYIYISGKRVYAGIKARDLKTRADAESRDKAK